MLNKLKLLTLAILFHATSSWATPMLWNLDNVTTVGTSQFHLGVLGSLTGSFVYDPVNDMYSNIMIRHVPDDVEPTPLTFSTFVGGSSTALDLFNGPPDPDGGIGRHSLSLSFLPLTLAGGPIALSGSATYFTGVRSEDITGGFLLADPASVPTPATLALFGLGLVGLGINRRKRQTHS